MTKKRAMGRKLLKGICLLLVLTGAVQLLISAERYFKHEQERKELAELLRQEEESQSLLTETGRKQEASADAEAMGKEAEKSPSMLAGFEELYQENPDIVGWLSIEGMKIDYPVMQNENDEYYLHHNFQKDKDKYGCLYVRWGADVFTPGTNFIIYGHNMKDGSMFGDLDHYRTKGFYEEHSLISFDTLYEERTYEIISVFLSQVYNEDDGGFKYYQFYQADSEEEFNYFYQNIRRLALYDTGVEAEYGDTFLTLSTCAYHVEDGRLVVVAKKIA